MHKSVQQRSWVASTPLPQPVRWANGVVLGDSVYVDQRAQYHAVLADVQRDPLVATRAVACIEHSRILLLLHGSNRKIDGVMNKKKK